MRNEVIFCEMAAASRAPRYNSRMGVRRRNLFSTPSRLALQGRGKIQAVANNDVAIEMPNARETPRGARSAPRRAMYSVNGPSEMRLRVRQLFISYPPGRAIYFAVPNADIAIGREVQRRREL